jgi:hypothetical protein
MSNSEPKPVRDLSNRILKKIGEIDPKLLESNNVKEIEVRSVKKQKSEIWQISLDNNSGHLRKWKRGN